MKAWRPPVLRPSAALARIRTASSGFPATARACSAASIRPPSAGRSIPCRPEFPGLRASAPPRPPYNLNANRQTGHVWINGSNSDTLIRFEPKSGAVHRLPAPDARELHARDRVRCRQQRLDLHVERAVGTRRSRARQVREARAAAAGRRVRQRPARDRRGVRRRQRDRLRRLHRGLPGRDGLRRRRHAAAASSATTATPTIAMGARRRVRWRPVFAAAMASSTRPAARSASRRGSRRCSLACTHVAGCGNGIVEAGEACDDGNTDDCDGCTSRCTLTAGCGDGVRCGGRGVR